MVVQPGFLACQLGFSQMQALARPELGWLKRLVDGKKRTCGDCRELPITTLLLTVVCLYLGQRMSKLSRLVRRCLPGRAMTGGKQRDTVHVTPWGFRFVGHEAMATGTFEPQETALVRNALLDVDALVNVGANVGYYCCHALSLGRQVLAVEPIARNVEHLLKNLDLNGWADGVRVFPLAAGARPGVLAIWGGGTAASLVRGWAGIPEGHTSLVPILPLDEVIGATFANQRLLIVVDVEGAEFQLLQGAVATLERRPRPTWLVEISLHEHQPTGVNSRFAQTFEVFFEHGYRAFAADGRQQEVTRDVLARIVRGESEVATHNYLFR